MEPNYCSTRRNNHFYSLGLSGLGLPIILQSLNIHQHTPISSSITPCPLVSNPLTWSPPPTRFLKLNLNRASRGNPDPASDGGSLHNSEGCIILIYIVFLTTLTNNEVKLWGLKLDLKNSLKFNYHQLIVEGDSLLLISILKKVQNEMLLSRASSNLRLKSHLRRVIEIINRIKAPIFSHVRCIGNKIVDLMENHALDSHFMELEMNWS